MLARVVMAVGEASLQKKLTGILEEGDLLVKSLKGKKTLWERLTRETTDVFLLDRTLFAEPFLDKVNLLHDLPDSPSVVVLSGEEDSEETAKLLAAGCEAALYSGLPAEEIADVIITVVEKRTEIVKQSLALGRMPTRYRLSDFVSESPAMQTFVGTVRRVVNSDCSLLILGETGVGKEHLARAIHAEGARSEGPFVAVNCGALPEALLESELFGHEEGAFTGATRSRRGSFEMAHRGTIFLDEIGDMPRHLQVKLLRALQEYKIQRLGSENPISVDVRVMAASNRDLEADVEEGDFRKDLYYRLSVVSLTVPALRNRVEDIPALVDSYISYFGNRIGSRVIGIVPEALEALRSYPWPGNVRELINIIERAMLLCDGAEITTADFPAVIADSRTPLPAAAVTGRSDTIAEEWLEKPLAEARREVLETFERAYLSGLLKATGGRVGETARRAGIEPRSLYDKMKHHGLRKEDFHAPGKRR